VIRDRAVLTDKETELQALCENGEVLSKPDHWGGKGCRQLVILKI
jgi:pyridoxine/pyridoxamine 5'-phosphate oxidase